MAESEETGLFLIRQHKLNCMCVSVLANMQIICDVESGVDQRRLIFIHETNGVWFSLSFKAYQLREKKCYTFSRWKKQKTSLEPGSF